jgi:MFS family permease
MKKPISLAQLLVLNAYWVGLSFMWNALHPIILPAVLLNYVPNAQKNTYLGLLTFVGLFIAMLIQPISGAISDGWASRFGRRRPLIVLGTLFDFVFLLLLAFGGGLLWLFVGYVGLQISSNIAHGPLQGLLPDRVPKQQVGVASSLKTFMDMLSLIIASLLAGRLLDPQTRNPTNIMLVLIGLLAISASITIFFTPEEPTHDRARLDLRGVLATFKIDFRQNTAYWWLIAERALFLLGIYGVQAFAQYYLQDVLRVADPPRETGDLLAYITIGLVILVLIGGWLTDRFGAKRILYFASAITAVGMLLMLLATDVGGLKIFGSIVGAGIGLFLTSNWALANALAPGEQAGKFLGLTNIATAGSGALARLEGPALDLLNGAWPGVWVGYKGLFIFGAACMLLSMLLLARIHDRTHIRPEVIAPTPLAG